MGDRSKAKMDCHDCGMHRSLCLCARFEKRSLRSRITMVIPWLEWRKTSNTGRLAGLLLENSRLLLRGKKGQVFSASDAILPDYRNLVLYPGGAPLSPEHSRDLPVNLIVPDGTWDSAAKLLFREPAVAALPRVSIPCGEPSAYRLRQSPVQERLSTLEAVARALEVLEGPQVRQYLEEALRVKVERVLWAKGRLDASEVSGGIPETAKLWKSGRSLPGAGVEKGE